MPVFLQACQPVSAQRVNRLEVFQTAVPTIEGDQTRVEPRLVSRGEHVTKVCILGHTIDGLVIQAIIAWDGVCAITPQKRDQIDTRYDPMMFA